MRLFRNQRLPYATILRPPCGLALEYVLISTYQLDLTALLTVPIALYQQRAGARGATLLGAVERTGKLVHAYCQACRINVPGNGSRLLDHLRDCVTEVRPDEPFVHVHPKVMIVRFTDGGCTTRYRLAVSTRNITLEPNWYVLLLSDGEVGRRRHGNGAAVAEFVDYLAAVESFPQASRFVDELERVDFAVPDGFDAMTIRPCGLSGSDGFVDLALDELVIAAPLLTSSVVRNLTAGAGSKPTVFTRRTTVDGLDADLRRRCRLFGLSALPAGTAAESTWSLWRDERAPQGVHLKAYAGRRGDDTKLLIGSANLTRGARDRNIELMVELTTDKGFHPAALVAALLAPEDGIEAFEPYAGAPADDSTGIASGDEWIAVLRRVEHSLSDRLRVSVGGAINEGPNGFDLELAVDLRAVTWPPEVEVRAAPLGLDRRSVRLRPGIANRVTFAAVGDHRPAGFIAFEIVVEGVEPSSFVAPCEWTGAPGGRREDLLTELEDDGLQFVRQLEDGLSVASADPNDVATRVAAAADGSLLERLIGLSARGAVTLEEGRELLRAGACADVRLAFPAEALQLWSAWAAVMDDPRPAEITMSGVVAEPHGMTGAVTASGAPL